MAKVTMYRGIDPVDGYDSLIAVSGEVCACSFYTRGSHWLTPERFGDMSKWATQTLPEFMTSFLTDAKTQVLWEADL